MAAFGWLISSAVRLVCFHVCSGCNVWFLPSVSWILCVELACIPPHPMVALLWLRWGPRTPQLSVSCLTSYPALFRRHSGRLRAGTLGCDSVLATLCCMGPLSVSWSSKQLEKPGSVGFIQRARPLPQQSSWRAVGCSHSLPLCA